LSSNISVLRAENERFYEKTDNALRNLFDAARVRNELHFSLSLNPEIRGARDAGWSSAQEVHTAFSDYQGFLQEGEPSRLKTRVALGFYCHLAEASGFYRCLGVKSLPLTYIDSGDS
jgi:hypothetical protein